MRFFAYQWKILSQRVLTLALPCAAVVGCGSNESSPLNSATGIGGTTVPGNGGATNPTDQTGGTNSNSNTGGTSNISNTGGANTSTTNGGTSVGGAAVGGAATGGGATVGGSVTGGNNSTGGAANVGGAATGGKASTGGVANLGGAATGGKASTGGAANLGGAATGGAATGTGGAATGTFDTSISEGEFSFFVVSLDFVLYKKPCTTTGTSTNGLTCLGGLGGDLRNGKANGIDGADSLCTEAAQRANPLDNHQWRAFLSAASYNGAALNAIDRVGAGPWYSAPPKYTNATSYANGGLLIASNVAGLKTLRPSGSTTIVFNDGRQNWPLNQCLLNENGYCTLADDDDHDTLTASNASGNLMGTAGTIHCDNWTNSTKAYGAPQIGHSWPRQLNGTDASSASWVSTTGHTGGGCGAIINTTETNYMQATSTWGGGVGSDGGYGAFYCFAVSN